MKVELNSAERLIILDALLHKPYAKKVQEPITPPAAGTYQAGAFPTKSPASRIRRFVSNNETCPGE